MTPGIETGAPAAASPPAPWAGLLLPECRAEAPPDRWPALGLAVAPGLPPPLQPSRNRQITAAENRRSRRRRDPMTAPSGELSRHCLTGLCLPPGTNDAPSPGPGQGLVLRKHYLDVALTLRKATIPAPPGATHGQPQVTDSFRPSCRSSWGPYSELRPDRPRGRIRAGRNTGIGEHHPAGDAVPVISLAACTRSCRAGRARIAWCLFQSWFLLAAH
jgi:hypothetical protein